jgi:16S rRNA (guanine527-N7)-methyltransferase
MKELFRNYWLEITNKQEEQFQKFLSLFTEKNAQVNLSAIRDEDGIIHKHFIDSIMVSKYIKIYWNVADVGTGGGFPGIPLKILYGDALDITFIDSIGKKVKAVEEFCTALEMKNFSCIHSRSENLSNKHKWHYNFVFSRAVAYFEDLLNYTFPLVKKEAILSPIN